MRISLFKTSILCLSLWMTGCATVTPQVPAQNQMVTWNDRVKTLSAIQEWDLKAAIAMHTPREAESGSLHWQQEHDDYTISLFGPLGASSMILSGSPGKVELMTPQGKKIYATSPEILLAQTTGWHLPVSQLTYWIRGLPAPDAPSTKRFDAYKHLIELNQQGWKIQYLRYTSVNHVDLPTKIFMNYPALNVRILITQWQFPQPA
jgi:outer membrane lipoprotein LolB